MRDPFGVGVAGELGAAELQTQAHELDDAALRRPQRQQPEIVSQPTIDGIVIEGIPEVVKHRRPPAPADAVEDVR